MALLLDDSFAAVLESVFEAAAEEGIEVRLTSGYRSIEKQKELIRRWERGEPGIFKPAKPGASFHNYGFAVDIRTSPPEALQRVGEIAEEFGLRWGGRFGDPVHIDMGSAEFTLSKAKKVFSRKNLVEVI